MAAILLSLASLSTGAWLAIIVAWALSILAAVWGWCKIGDARRMRKYQSEFDDYQRQLDFERSVAARRPEPSAAAPAPTDPTDPHHAAALMAGACYPKGADPQ